MWQVGHAACTHACVCVCGNLFITFIITPSWARAFIDLLVCIVYAYFIFISISISISLLGFSSLTHLLIAFTIHIQFALKKLIQYLALSRCSSRRGWGVKWGRLNVSQIKDTLRGRWQRLAASSDGNNWTDLMALSAVFNSHYRSPTN